MHVPATQRVHELAELCFSHTYSEIAVTRERNGYWQIYFLFRRERLNLNSGLRFRNCHPLRLLAREPHRTDALFDRRRIHSRPQSDWQRKFLCITVGFCLSVLLHAQETSRVLPFENVKTNLPANTHHDVIVQLWDNDLGGRLLYSELQPNLQIDVDGRIQFLFGSGKPNGLDPLDFPSGSSRYVDVVDSNEKTVLDKRIPLYAAPFGLSPGPPGPPGPAGPQGYTVFAPGSGDVRGTAVVNTTGTFNTAASPGNFSGSSATLGTTLLTNGNFATGDCTGWTCGTGWTVGSNAVQHAAGNTAALTQNVSVVSGSLYEIDLTQSAGPVGSLSFSLGSATTGFFPASYLGNVPTVSLIAVATGNVTFSVTPDQYYKGNLSNFMLRLVTPSAAALTISDTSGTTNYEERSSTSNTNTFDGLSVGQFDTSGKYNTALGSGTFASLTAGFLDVAVGYNAGQKLSTAYQTVAIGANALSSITWQSGNTAVGANSFIIATAPDNTGVGKNTGLFNTTGTLNTAVGSDAMHYNTTGVSNTALGTNAYQGTTGGYNTAIGNAALSGSVTGSSNTGVGNAALLSLTSGASNTAVGGSALWKISSISNTTGVGYNAGGVIPYPTTSANATFLGANTGLVSAQHNFLTVIGASAVGDCDNCVVLGRATDTAVIGGKTVQASGALLQVGGGGIQIVGATQPSCDAAHRGAIWYVAGGPGVKDTLNICAKDTADSYFWRIIY